MEFNFFLEHRLLKRLLFFSIVNCLLIYVIYYYQRETGILLSQEEWQLLKINHGPWRWQPEGLLMTLPMIIIPLTAIISLYKSVKECKVGILASGLLTVGAQIALFLFPFLHLFWTID